MPEEQQDVERNGVTDTVLEGIAILAEIHGWKLELFAAHNPRGELELTLLRVKAGRKFARGATIHNDDLRHATRSLWHSLPPQHGTGMNVLITILIAIVAYWLLVPLAGLPVIVGVVAAILVLLAGIGGRARI